MTIPLEITFANSLTSSDALRRRINKEAEKLDKFHGRIVACRVAVKGRSHRQKHGDLFDVRLQISTPGGKDIVIDRNPPADHAHEDPYVAIRDAFNAARRRLQDQHRRQQGKIKVHEALAEGRIVRLSKDGYGFIESADGREIYFHRNAVKNKSPDALRKGARVRFLESETDGLIQASTVHLIGSG
jgi:cold shock CspA family protein/ribosome-associated translation inhibitor RaiA